MNKNIILSLWGTVLALLAPFAQAQFGGGPAKLEVIKVRDDIYVISNVAVPGLTTALITNDGVLLVDDKFEVDHDSIMAALKTVTNQPVKYVINTHYHGDHSGGNAKLQALGTLAVASIEARASMVAANQSGQPNITVGDRAELYIGGKKVEIHKVGRAHTTATSSCCSRSSACSHPATFSRTAREHPHSSSITQAAAAPNCGRRPSHRPSSCRTTR